MSLITISEGEAYTSLTKRDQLFSSQNNILQHPRRSDVAWNLRYRPIVGALVAFRFRSPLQHADTVLGTPSNTVTRCPSKNVLVLTEVVTVFRTGV